MNLNLIHQNCCGLYADNSSGENINEKVKFPFEITADMIKEKTAVLVNTSEFSDNTIDSSDVSSLLAIKNYTYKDTTNIKVNAIKSSLAEALSCDKDDIEVQTRVIYPELSKFNISKIDEVFSTKTTSLEHAEEINKKIDENDEKIARALFEEDGMKWEEGKQTWDESIVKVNAIMPDGAIYSLTIGASGEYENNWYMVKTKEADPKPVFETKLDYTAIIDRENVGGTLTNGTFYPKYNEKKVEKDADVTATITSTTKNDIVKINDVELNKDGTKNSLGWYYVDKSDKTVIAKDYPFDSYDNLTANGIVNEKDLKLTSSDNLTDTQSVSIRWPFRIIDVKQTPSEIKEDTDKVIVTVTTNLPMDKDKLPEGWKFTSDDEGKTQHRISKEYVRKDGDKKEEVVVKANGRDDTDKTNTKIEWPEKKDNTQAPTPHPQTGATCLGAVALIGIAGFAVTRYRKLKK